MRNAPSVRVANAVRGALAIGFGTALLSAALPAAAVHEPLADPNDTDGRFDVRLVEHRHKARPRAWLITTYPRWTIRNSWDAGYAIVSLDTLGGPQQDYYAMIRSNGKRLIGEVFRDRDRGKDPVVGKPRAWKKGRTGGIEVPWSKLKVGDTRESYRWSVLTLWVGGPCPRTCFDLAPNGGTWIEQPYEEEPPEPPREAEGADAPAGVPTAAPTVPPTGPPTPADLGTPTPIDPTPIDPGTPPPTDPTGTSSSAAGEPSSSFG